MAELEDLEEHLTAVRSQNASLIGELESLKRQLSAASLSSIDTTIPSASAVPAYRHLGRPASSPMLRRGGSHRPSRTPEAARRLAGGSRRRAATAGAARTTPLAPSLVDFLDSVGLSSCSRTVHVPKGPASVYSPQRPRTPSMMHRCPPKFGTNHPPPRCPPTSRAQTLDVWRKEQDARREADELRWRRHACEGASGASLAKELKERSRRAGLPEQTVTIAGQSRPATAQIDRRRAPLLRKRPPLTRSVASFDATERRLWSTTVSTGLEQQVAALMAAAGGTRPDTAARVAAEVHAAHAASLAARAAAREAAAAGSSGELLVLDDGDSEREAAAPATEEEARSSTSAQESHRAGCRVLLDVIRGWDTSGKCKLDRAHFEFMLSTLAPDVIVDPELQRTLLDECDTREPGVADLRLFCEMLADESNVGRVTFSAELQPNTRRSLRSAKELPIGSNVLGQPAQPAPWAEPYGDGSNHREIAVTTSDEVNSALRAQLARLGEQLRARDPDQTGELSESDFIEGISSMNFLLSSSEIESLFRDADKSASGKVLIDRFVARAHEQISSKNVVPAYMVLKHQRSIDMSTSLKWSTDERFTEREGRAELKRWLRCHPSPFSEEALSLR